MNPHVDKEDAGVAKLLGTVLAGKLLEVRVVQATVGCQALNEIFKFKKIRQMWSMFMCLSTNK